MTELPIDGCKLRECNSCVLVTVTIARAIELKHAPGLIAALAYDTASFYQKADNTLSSLEPAHSAKWRKYLHLKMCFYTAYVSARNPADSEPCRQ